MLHVDITMYYLFFRSYFSSSLRTHECKNQKTKLFKPFALKIDKYDNADFFKRYLKLNIFVTTKKFLCTDVPYF